MSNCKTPSFIELSQAVKNRQFLKMAENSEQPSILAALDFTSEYIGLAEQKVNPRQVGDDLRRYTLIDPANGATSVFLSNRVTDSVARFYRKIFGDDKKENTIQMEYGTQVHKVMQLLLQEKVKGYRNSAYTPDFDSVVNVAMSGNYPLTQEQVSTLGAITAELFTQMKQQQERIDPNKKFDIRTENVVVDPRRDLAGTTDLVVVYSNGTSGVYDFKTMSPKPGSFSRKANAIELNTSDFVAPTTRMGWEIQMNAYKDILLEYYGVKDVLYTRMVPIIMDYNYDLKTGKIVGLSNIVEPGKLNKPRSVGVEKFQSAAVNEFLKQQYLKIEELKTKLAKAARLERAPIAQELQRIYDAIDDFANNLATKEFVHEAMAIANKAAKNEFDGSFTELKSAYTYLKSIIDFSRALQDSSDDVDIKLEMDMDFIAKQAAILHEKYIQMTLDGVQSRYGAVNMQGGEIILSEDDILTQLASTTSESQNPILRHAQDLFQESYNKQRRDLTEFDKALSNVEQPLIEWLRGRGETLADVYKYLLNKEKGLLYGRISEVFIQNVTKQREDGNVAFFKDNYQIKTGQNKKGQTYNQWLTANRKEVQTILENRFKYIEDAGARAKRVSEELIKWDKRNDLRNNEAWLNKHHYWLELKPTVVKANLSTEYQFIENNKPLKDYYEFWRNTIADWRSEVGYDMIHSALFYPMVRASMVEKLGRSEAFGTLLKDIKEVLEVKQDTQMFGSTEYEEVDQKRVPLYFTQPFRDANGDLDTTQMSTDMSASLRLMAKTVYNHKHMEDVEANILALQDVLQMVKYEQAGWGTKVFDFMHNIALKDKSQSGSMTDTVFNAIKDYHLYGIKVQPFGGKQFTKVTTDLMQYFSLKSLGLGIIPATASYAAAQVSARLEAAKGQIWDTKKWNHATKLMATDAKKYNGIAYFFGVHNNDMLQDIIRARTGVKNILGNGVYNSQLNKYIDQRLLMAPWSYGQERLDNHITVAMAHSYGIDSNGNVRLLENLPEEQRIPIYERMQFDENTGAFTIEGLKEEQLSRAIMQFQQAVRAGQKRVAGTLSEEDIAYWQTTLVGKLLMQFKSWMPSILKERFGALRYNDILDVAEQGRYRVVWENNEYENNANTMVYVLRTTLNTMGFVLKNLFTYGTPARMLGAKLSLNEAHLQKQYAMLKKKYENYPGMLEKMPTFESFVKMKEGQIRAALGELEVLVLLTAAIYALGADWDDDGEPMWSEMWATHQIYKVLNRTRTELSFTNNPIEYAKLVSNPIPLTGLLTHTYKLVANTLDETRDVLINENDARDKTDKLHYSSGMIMGVYQLRKFFDVLTIDEAAAR